MRNRVSRHLSELRNHLSNHISRHIRQSEIPPIEEVSQLFVIDPKQMQYCRMEVIYAHAVGHRFVAQLVRRSIERAALYAAACHPGDTRVRIVVASGPALLYQREPAEFSAPNNQS